MKRNETRLPPPEMPVLVRLDEMELAELIEQHIDYVDQGRSVHLPMPFVRHYLRRDDGALPIVYGIATLPMVLLDGGLLSGRGLDRRSHLVFRVPPELERLLPKREDCTKNAVAEAMQFLCDEWLVDVATTSYQGKCILIAAALTIIERHLLPDRPVFLVTAGRRGGGKTTTLTMLIMAVTGLRAAAAAWSTNEEERRKALLAYLRQGIPYLVWDNIARGSRISCPHIEKACTAADYSDRVLGVSNFETVSAATIHLFTGNNVSLAGDLLPRGLEVRLAVDRPDPENRPFKHPDPIDWTEANRGRILQAMYTILLGNPQLEKGSAAQTRFKMWWRLIGSAVEHAAKCHVEHAAKRAEDVKAMAEEGVYESQEKVLGAPEPVSFSKLFLNQEAIDEETVDLGEALDALVGEWPKELPGEWPKGKGFKAAQLAKVINDRASDWALGSMQQRGMILREFLFPKLLPIQDVTPKMVTSRLKTHVDNPIRHGKRTLVLKASFDSHEETLWFCVDSTGG